MPLLHFARPSERQCAQYPCHRRRSEAPCALRSALTTIHVGVLATRVPVRWIADLFLIAHGLVHAAIWLAPKSTNAPFDPHHSPILADVRILATTLGVLAGLGFIVSGCGYLLGEPWWPSVHWHQQPYP
jgi:hypothetical protein